MGEVIFTRRCFRDGGWKTEEEYLWFDVLEEQKKQFALPDDIKNYLIDRFSKITSDKVLNVKILDSYPVRSQVNPHKDGRLYRWNIFKLKCKVWKALLKKLTNPVYDRDSNENWLYWCFTALRHIVGHFGRGQLT